MSASAVVFMPTLGNVAEQDVVMMYKRHAIGRLFIQYDCNSKFRWRVIFLGWDMARQFESYDEAKAAFMSFISAGDNIARLERHLKDEEGDGNELGKNRRYIDFPRRTMRSR